MTVLASAGGDIAAYLSTLVYVYSLIIFLYILSQWMITLGVRPGYSRPLDAVLAFLRDVCEPYLRLFRRIVPMMGGLDISPILAILTLYLVNRVVLIGILGG